MPLYRRLVWNELSPGCSVSATGSVVVEGVLRGFVRDDRVVLLFDERRVAELVAQGRGTVHTGNNHPGWLAVDPRVDEPTFRELFHEAVGAAARTSLLAEFRAAIAQDLLALPELSRPDWETATLVVEAFAGSVTMTAYRYTESGPPMHTAPPDHALYRELNERIRGVQGEEWDVAVAMLHRQTGRLRLRFFTGRSADRWHATPANREHLPESLRPGPDDFPGVPFLTVPVFLNEDVNLVIGDRTTTTPSSAAWPEVSRHRYAVWAGRAAAGACGLLVRARGTVAEEGRIRYEVTGPVRLSDVTRRDDGGHQARVEAIPTPPSGRLDGVVDRAELRRLLRRAADRDPAFVTGWRRAELPAPTEPAERSDRAVAEDLLRRLPMPLSQRIELAVTPERDRYAALVDRLRELADGTPPPEQTAQRIDRPLIDLPREAVPVLPHDIWLTPGAVSTITASPFISDRALAAGWLAFTADLTVGRVAMATRPLRRSDTVDENGFHLLSTDQIRPAVIRAVVPGEAGRSLIELVPAPSAEEAAGRGLPEPEEERRLLATYLDLLRRASGRDQDVTGTASGAAYRLWLAGRFTSLRALLSWQIGQLGFGAQTVLDLQAIAWPDRFAALTAVLRAVAEGRTLGEARPEAAAIAAAALDAAR